MLALGDYADRNTRLCFPSMRSLAERTRTNIRNVQKMMDRLVEKGLVDRELNAGPFGCNLYTIYPRSQGHPGKTPPRPHSHHNPVDGDGKPPSPETYKPSGLTVKEPSVIVDSDESTPSLEDSESDSQSDQDWEDDPSNGDTEQPTPPETSAPAPPPMRGRMPPPLSSLKTGHAPGSPINDRSPIQPPSAKQGPKQAPTRQPAKLLGEETADLTREWNKMAMDWGLPRIMGMTAARKATFATRLKDEYFRNNWRKALEQLPIDEFRRGKNDRGWRATIDYFLRPSTVLKLMEEADATANAKPGDKRPQSNAPSPDDTEADVLRKVLG